MKKTISKLMLSLSTIVSSFALFLAVSSVTQACFCFVHQPEIPDGLKKYED